jgi:hypothetical protein
MQIFHALRIRPGDNQNSVSSAVERKIGLPISSFENESTLAMKNQPLTYVCTTAFLAFLICSPLQAQQYVEVLRAEHVQGFGQRFDSLNTPAVFNESAIDFTLPIPSAKLGGNIITGVLMEQSTFSLYPGGAATTVYGTAFKLGFNKKHTDHLSATYVLVPKISSDFRSIDQRDLQLGCLLLFKYAKSETFNYRFGLYANTELFGPFLVPILGMYYKNNNLEISGNLPLNADINYSLGKYFKIGGRFQGINKSFNLHRPNNTYVERSYNEAGAYAQLALGKVNFMLFGGHSFLRSYKVFVAGDKMDLSITALRFGGERTPLNDSFGNAFLCKAAIFVRIPTP